MRRLARDNNRFALGIVIGIAVGGVLFAITQQQVWIGLAIPLGAALGIALQANRR